MFKKYGFFFLVLVIQSGCSNKLKDEPLGLYVDYKGLKADRVLVYANQVPKKSREIKFGDELNVEILGITDFKPREDGRVMPDAEYAVSDEFGNVLFLQNNFFKKFKETGVSQGDAAKLKLNLVVGSPMERGKSYYFLFRIWDQLSQKELKGNIQLDVR